MQVVDADAVLDRLEADLVGRAVAARRPSRRRRPASTVKACGLWSRPVVRPSARSAAGRTRRPRSPACRRAARGARGRRAARRSAGRSRAAKPPWFFAMSLCPSQLSSFSMPPRVDLHEPHAALDQPPGDQALPGEVRRTSGCRGRRASCVSAVSLVDVERLGRGHLHPVGQLERLDAGRQVGLGRVLLQALAG